jgi:hypothetical protein
MKFANQVPLEPSEGDVKASKKTVLAGDAHGNGGTVTMHGYAVMATLLQGWKDVSLCAYMCACKYSVHICVRINISSIYVCV